MPKAQDALNWDNPPLFKAPEGKSPRVSTLAGKRDGSRPVDEPDPEPTPATGELIWRSDFDNSPEWQVQHLNQRYHYQGATESDGTLGYVAADNIPPGFDWYYTSELFHPNGTKDGNNPIAGSNPVAAITTDVARRPGGKALVIHDESNRTSGSGSEWGTDANLTKDFQETPEVYLETAIRFQDTYVFDDWPEFFNGGTAMIKLFRIGRFTGNDTDSVYTRVSSQSEVIGPMLIVQLGSYTAASGNQYTQINAGVRRNPYGNKDDYFHQLQGPGIAERLIDSQWHTFGCYMKMNSAAGVSDGVYEMFIDGEKVASRTGIEWNTLPEDDGLGWNLLHFGGNADNRPYPDADQYEQWLAYDDVYIYNGKPEGMA